MAGSEAKEVKGFLAGCKGLEKERAVLRPIQEYESVRTTLTGLSERTRSNYLLVIPEFCKFVGKDPDQIIAERREHMKSDDEKVKRTYERLITEFYGHLKKRMAENSAFIYTAAIRGFFSRNYLKTSFRRGDLRAPKTESNDYIPTLGEMKEIVDAADIRDKAIILLAMQTGIAPVDVVGLKRATFEMAMQRGEPPMALGWLEREKTRVKYHPFLFSDSARAIKRYLQNRKDEAPWLFVERTGEQMSERNLNDIFQKAAKRAGIKVPEDMSLRIYCCRHIFETQMGNAGIPQTWIDLMMGHVTAGSRGKYVAPPENEWLEKVRKAESYISISRVSNIVSLREKINEARRDDLLELITLLEKELGRDTMKRLADGYLKIRPMIPEFGEDDLAPSGYVMAEACEEFLAQRKRRGKGGKGN